MSENQDDLPYGAEHEIFLGKKTELRQKEKSQKIEKSDNKEKPENAKINLQPKKRKRRKKYSDSFGLQESDSKEYIEEEEEEENEYSVSIKNSDNGEESSESKSSQNKKLKLDDINNVPGWVRTYKDSNANEPNLNNQSSNVYNNKKAPFVTNLSDSVNNDLQNKNFNVNNNSQYMNIQSSNLYQFSINNQVMQSTGSKIYMGDMNVQNKKFMNNIYFNKSQSNQNVPNKFIYNQQQQQRPIIEKVVKLLNIQAINYFLDTRFKDFKFNKDNDRLYEVLYENLINYFRTYLLRLIKISRIRNVSFHLYSNNPNGQIHYKFRTYNSQLSADKKSINYIKSGNFDILFTSNYKKDMDLIDEYVELNNKKLKFEKLSSCKEKDEENDKVKGIETSIKITEGPYPTIKLLPGRRTKKKDNSFIKEVRKKIVQTQKKEDLLKQNCNTKNTLEAFLNETEFTFKNKGKNINSLLDDSKSNNKMDLSSRMSDNLSNMYSYTNNTFNQIKNEIDMNIYKYFDPTKNEEIQRTQKRRINMKDFIFVLENSNEYIPNKMFILNKASVEFIKKNK